VNPSSITGTGQVSLTVNTTPSHPLTSKLTRAPGWFAAGGGASLACLVMLALPRHRGRGRIVIALMCMVCLFTAVGCSSGAGTATDPGTPKGTYNVVVTGTAGSGTSQSQVSASVPITID
jgi:hypothetical protein